MSTPPTPIEVEYLKMIQTNIDRMNRCSFECKKWSVGLVAAILAAAAGTKPWLALFGIVPAVIFGYMDAYYLWVERGFRKLYDEVRIGNESFPFIMDPMRYLNPDSCAEDSLCAMLMSKTVLWVHLVTLVGAVLVGLIGADAI